MNPRKIPQKSLGICYLPTLYSSGMIQQVLDLLLSQFVSEVGEHNFHNYGLWLIYGHGSKPMMPYLGGWTCIYHLYWCSLGARVLTHCHIYTCMVYKPTNLWESQLSMASPPAVSPRSGSVWGSRTPLSPGSTRSRSARSRGWMSCGRGIIP